MADTTTPSTRRRRRGSAIDRPKVLQQSRGQGQKADTPGRRAAPGGASGNPRKQRRPGPGPARRRDSPGQHRPGVRGAQGRRRVRRPPRLRPEDRKPLLRRPRRRHRRLDKRHVPGEGRREGPKRRMGVLLGVPGPGRAPRARPGPGLPAGDAGRGRGRQEGRLLRRRPHPPAGPHLGQDSVRPQPGALGQSLRRVGHRGRPRDPLRSCRAGVRRGRRQLPGRIPGA